MKEINPRRIRIGKIYFQVMKSNPKTVYIKKRVERKSKGKIWGEIVFKSGKLFGLQNIGGITWCSYYKADFYLLDKEESTPEGIKRIIFREKI